MQLKDANTGASFSFEAWEWKRQGEQTAKGKRVQGTEQDAK